MSLPNTLDYCERNGCRVSTSDLQPVLVAERTHSSPAEYEMVCSSCRGDGRDDDDHELAAARYDGEGKDWR